MKSVSMSGSLRENVGKKDAKKHRKEGKVPCVLYGGKEQIHFTLNEKGFSTLIFTPEVYLINLNIGGVDYNAILQDVQYHPVNDRVLHVDFLELLADKPVVIGIPLKVIGVSPGILAGGKLHQKKRKLNVKGLKENLPDFINIDISELEIGDAIKVKDIKIKDLELLDSPRDMVIAVKATRIAAGMGMGEDEELAAAEAEGEEGEGEEGEGEEGPTEE